MKVAVLGGGPSGAFAAEKLASAGARVTVFDEKLAWEKPCGGGVTWKAYSQYPFLFDNATPKKVVTETVLAAPKSAPATLALDHPLLIFSRYDLNSMLLARAQSAGAQMEQTRVLGAARTGAGWRLKTKSGDFEADYCVLATGARNPLRSFGTELTSADTMSALGYYVPAARERIDIQFLPNLEGYIWVFPRCGHLSVGICGKGEPASALRARLDRYMAEQGLSKDGATFYSHLLPCLDTPAWKRNRVAGDRWMAVGDAAGLVDPITGEGIYYALRSGDLAAQVIVAEGAEMAGAAYRRLLRRDFTGDLEFGSRLASRVFHGRFLWGAVTSRMVQFTRLSPKFREVMQDLFEGSQSYVGLKKRLFRNLNWSIIEIVCSLGFARLVPRRENA
ncbi:MAG TPA: NAD(P)/FAD-dependent oxidoreductase [Bryobacteraceae bacterium]|nr:NAD(P)/FAD-dependent oxidoreductase [Bryobacteraceae bacterium]